ncbi:MAG: hypothetical protein CVT80_08065 [Alphaproteobacteria bacterium HGW-Alphaproteobacteria-2]|nr:MAG: hypothetical protein CVT80_08065 [Alphaproteobacteria bacterium HGW-Alphaproteobacteria-2]
MLEITPDKVAEVIVLSRVLDAKVGNWDSESDEDDGETILEMRRGDPAEQQLREFIEDMNEDEQASLVAVAWIGRGTFEPEDLEEAIQTARDEAVNATVDYLLGMPLLPDYLEDGLDKLGISVEEAEDGIL